MKEGKRMGVILASCEHHFIRVYENLVQHSSNNKKKKKNWGGGGEVIFFHKAIFRVIVPFPNYDP